MAQEMASMQIAGNCKIVSPSGGPPAPSWGVGFMDMDNSPGSLDGLSCSSLCLRVQVLAKERWYAAQLLVESNATLETVSIKSLLDSTSFQLNDSDGVLHTINVTYSYVLAECRIFGMDYHCACSAGYTWSNAVCYTANCCRDAACEANVMDIQPLCIQKEQGLVSMVAPSYKLSYKSRPKLRCSFDEATDSSGWTVSRWNEAFELKNGSMVNLDYKCRWGKSCVEVTIQKMTGLWAGTYECEFKKGSVRHVDTKTLTVSLLPDSVTMVVKPLTVDCLKKTSAENVSVSVTATIQRTNETYAAWWSYKDNQKNYVSNKSSDGLFLYDFGVPISCNKTTAAHVIKLTFRNSEGEEKSQSTTVPVIYGGDPFCSEEALDDVLWPKTPSGDTVFNKTCPAGRVGYKSRTCNGTAWMPVYPRCVNEALDNLLTDSETFLTGLGSTKERATHIFEILRNNSEFSNSSDGVADIDESIEILNVMSRASENVDFDDKLLPYFAEAASNMVNQSWSQINTSVVYRMSATFLQSVEDLVMNIKVNNSEGYKTENLDISYCFSKGCNASSFNTRASVNMTSGIMKTVAVKNLMDKLRNNFNGTVKNSLLISATLENDSSSVQISLEFPTEIRNSLKPMCVYWNTTAEEWSDAGCFLKSKDAGFTVCQCNHLTSFSILMAKSDISSEDLDAITLVGLSLSVASLVVFLLVEFLVWSAVIKTPLSHFRHTAMVNIATFLLLANCSFLASTAPEDLSASWCLILTICKHLFFLAMFSWMLCLSVLLVHQLIFVFHPLRKRVFMFLSSFTGYFCPVIIVGTSYVYYEYTDKPYYDSDTCWLVFEELLNGSVHAFFIPVGTIVLTNFFSLIVVVVTLVKTSAPDKSDDKETAKGILKVMFILTPVFGVTWIIGFFLLLLDEGTSAFKVANYSFTILNSFQGVFILITGCVLEQKVRQELWKIIMVSFQCNRR
ncbi:adhesion G-protein coupled receptor F3 [Neosynchiropus ocellatus]